MPEWYYDEDEWCGEEDFPFKGLDTKYIKTVVFRLNPPPPSKAWGGGFLFFTRRSTSDTNKT